MSIITLRCGCGKKLKVNPELAGRKLRCVSCGRVGRVPSMDSFNEPRGETREKVDQCDLCKQTTSLRSDAVGRSICEDCGKGTRQGKCERCGQGIRRSLLLDSSRHWVCRECRANDEKEEKLAQHRADGLAYLHDAGLQGVESYTDDDIWRLSRIVGVFKARGVAFASDASLAALVTAIRSLTITEEKYVYAVTHNNADGSSRQAAIRRCKSGDPVRLIREPGNSYDANAVKVCLRSGEQIGYLSAEDTERGIARHIDDGAPFSARVADVHKSRKGGKSYFGVVLLLSWNRYWDW